MHPLYGSSRRHLPYAERRYENTSSCASAGLFWRFADDQSLLMNPEKEPLPGDSYRHGPHA